MSHANLCQQCASKRESIVQRTGHYEHGARCDACRRLTKTALCHAVAMLQPDHVVTYDDLLDGHDSLLNY